MSVSRINATSGSMAAAAAIAQAQALQYAHHFAELHNAIDSGDLGAARKALSAFQRDAAVTAVNGFDPISQISSLRREFSGIRKALLKGDISAAQTSLSSLRKEIGLLQPADTEDSLPGVLQPFVETQSSEVLPARPRLVLAPDGNHRKPSWRDLNHLGADGALPRDIRSAPDVLSEEPQKTSRTFIKTQPALSSFAQGPQVFPTSDSFASKISVPTVKTSTQAVLQGLAATQPNAQELDLDGTPFAPSPEMMLGSKGMSIPAGAQLQFEDNPITLRPVAFLR
jgi:hypothetical protein